jgi:hypothetical protein
MNEQLADHAEDTITLLLEEVARLEAELRSREAEQMLPSPEKPRVDDNNPADDALRRQVAELTADLVGRDETITVLLEQTQLFEETAAAQHAEWEILHQWVDEVEQRVQGNDVRDLNLEAELDAERRRGESLRQTLERERVAAAARIQALEHSAESQRQFDRSADQGTPAIELQRENHRLRQECARLEGITQAELPPLRQALDTARSELEAAKRDLLRVVDEQERERKESAAAMGELRSKLARESLVNDSQTSAAARPTALTEADERIRAFREHLRELHKSEAQERANRSLSSRLSRLWRNTGPT